MKRSLSGLVVILLLTSIVKAEQPRWDDFEKLIIGDWSAQGAILAEGDGGPLKRGDEFTMRASYQTAAGGRAALGTQVLTLVDQPGKSFSCTATFGWNPIARTIEGRAYWSEGAVEEISLSDQQGDNFHGTYTILLPTGQQESADIAVKTSGNDKFTWAITSGANAGKPISSWQRIRGTGNGE